MKITTTFLCIVLLFLIGSNHSMGQQSKVSSIPDSLMKMSYMELEKGYRNYRNEKPISKYYASAYLNKAKAENNNEEIVLGYNYLADCNESQLKFIFLDSMVYHSKSNYKDLIAFSYYTKANAYFTERKNKIALDNYILAEKNVDRKKKPYLLNSIKYGIGILKSSLGYYEEGIILFRESNVYFKKINDPIYLLTLYGLAENYNKIGDLVKSEYYTDLGKKESVKFKDKSIAGYFDICEGLNLHKQKKYAESTMKLKRILPFLKEEKNDFANYSVNCFYIGQNYIALHQNEIAIEYFKKVDSVFMKEKDIYPENSKAYTHLINHYKVKGDIKMELYYTQHLIKADSVINANYHYLSTKIQKEYDTPQLIREKDKIISQLKQEESFSTVKNVGLLSIMGGLLGFGYLNFKRQKRYQNKYEKLIQKQLSKDVTEKEIIIEKKSNSTSSNKEIQEHIITNIQNKLQGFEESLGFLSNECNLDRLAVEFETNKKYLSKIINETKQVSFTVYINNLRVDHILCELQTDKKLRLLTIEAIGGKAGFNTAETFSKAFFSRTELQPSYFIKQLKKKDLQLT